MKNAGMLEYQSKTEKNFKTLYLKFNTFDEH